MYAIRSYYGYNYRDVLAASERITWRLGLDKLEQLALALPLGIAILALPGIV